MTFDNLIVCGDIHDKTDVIIDFINKYKIENSAIFIAGDYGIGFKHHLKEESRLRKLTNKLKVNKNIVYVVRGNHDNPSYFTGYYDTTNVKFVPDYTVYNFNNINILCVGGAVSIDRTNRLKYNTGRGRDWWIDEIFVYKHEIVNKLKNIDVVITHSSPNFAYPYLKENITQWFDRDLHLKSDVEHERSAIANLYYQLIDNGNIIKKWYYGHFHSHNEMYFNDTKFTCLNINKFVDIKF